ncbi:MAG: protein translocase subunit SecF [DPANN group archaeon]|nr:protein translocase subunit SecF [DPANN group archaeon]
MSLLKRIADFYDTHYKFLLLIPMILLSLSLFVVIQHYLLTGEIVNRGVSLKGGVTITIPDVRTMTAPEMQAYLRSLHPDQDIIVGAIKNPGGVSGLNIEADINDEKSILSLEQEIEDKLHLQKADYNEEIMGSSLGASFFLQTIKAIIIAFLFMSVVVFLYFKIPVPSLAVVLAAFSDMVTTLAVIDLLGMKLSTAGIAAFLMLIGYSVDTDILLSTRVLRRKKGTVAERIRKAMKTGFMMSATTLGAVIAGLLVAESAVIIQIMSILLIGLCADLIYTWLQNGPLLRMYLERKRHV